MFSDLFEEEHLFYLLDEAARAPVDAPKELFDFIYHRQYSHIRKKLRELRDRIISSEKEHGVTPGASMQSKILLDLDTLLKACFSTTNLKNNLPEIKLLISHAYSITLDIERDILQPDVEEGRKFLKRQSFAGKRRAEVRWGRPSRLVADRIISCLRKREDELGDRLSAKELWPLFYSELDTADLNPKETSHSDPRKSRIDWADGGRLTFGAFENKIIKKS